MELIVYSEDLFTHRINRYVYREEIKKGLNDPVVKGSVVTIPSKELMTLKENIKKQNPDLWTHRSNDIYLLTMGYLFDKYKNCNLTLNRHYKDKNAVIANISEFFQKRKDWNPKTKNPVVQVTLTGLQDEFDLIGCSIVYLFTTKPIQVKLLKSGIDLYNTLLEFVSQYLRSLETQIPIFDHKYSSFRINLPPEKENDLDVLDISEMSRRSRTSKSPRQISNFINLILSSKKDYAPKKFPNISEKSVHRNKGDVFTTLLYALIFVGGMSYFAAIRYLSSYLRNRRRVSEKYKNHPHLLKKLNKLEKQMIRNRNTELFSDVRKILEKA